MKTTKLFVVMLVLLLVSSGFGQMQRESQIELFGGAAMPMAPDFFKDYFKVGLSLHGQYVMFPSPKMGLVFGVAYEPFSVDNDKFLEDMTGYTESELEDLGMKYDVEIGLNILEFGVGVRPYLSAPESPTQVFLLGMGTYNIMKIKSEGTIGYYDSYGDYYEEDMDETETENKAGVALGGGIEIPAGESMNLIFQGLYRFIFTEDETSSFLGITAGLVF